jgi:glycopeptide antibiotics resistance protein
LRAPSTIDATVLLPLLLAYLALVAAPAVRRRAYLTARRLVVLTALVLYGLGVVAITIFPIVRRPPEFWLGEPWWTVIHWIPFYVDAPSFVLNVIMMEPFGLLVPLMWPRTGSLRRIATWALATSAAIELIQFILGLTLGSRRTVDVNDLIANTAGAVIGFLLLKLAAPIAAGRAPVAATEREAPTSAEFRPSSEAER